MCTPTVTKEIMKPHVGSFPSWLDSNCKYAIARVDAYPVALFAFQERSSSGQPIAISFYSNKLAIQHYGVKRSMWKNYQETFDTLPLLPVEYKRLID